MSSIWTPSGEHGVPDDGPKGIVDLGAIAHDGDSPMGPGSSPGPGQGNADSLEQPEISPEEVAAMRHVHAQIRSTPAVDVVANHGIQLFELALIYLGVATPPDEQGRVPMPDLAQAGVAIDAMAVLVDGLGVRFGENEQTLRDALSQIQMLYVQVADQLNEQFGDNEQ